MALWSWTLALVGTLVTGIAQAQDKPAFVFTAIPDQDESRLVERGTVNLIGSGRDKAHEGRSHEGLCPSGHAGDLGPGLEGLGPGGSILAGGAVVAAEVGQVIDLIVSGEEGLSLAGRLEALHLSLPSPGRLMRILRPVVQAFVPPMLDQGHHGG